MWEGGSLWILSAEHESAEIEAHSHHAIQITFELEGSFKIHTRDETVSGPIVAVASDISHMFCASGAAAFLFIEPESAVGRVLSKELFRHSSVASLRGQLAKSCLEELKRCFVEEISEDEMLRLGRKIVSDLRSASGPPLANARVQAMIDYARNNLEEKITLSAAAKHINLSESRARHLFVAHTGLPFKAYILWLRLGQAVQLYAAGSSLTEAAHHAGFADSAHFSRTFKRTFGLTAAGLRLDVGTEPDAQYCA